MRRWSAAGYLLAAIGLSACAGNPAPVPVRGEVLGIQRLVGEWVGSYESRDSDRNGSILFQLEAGRDTAYGDVLMIQAEQRIDYVAPYDDTQGVRQRSEPLPQVLTIRFVMVTGDLLSGILDPYEDPRCGCRLRTVFEGRLTDDHVQGTYESEHRGSGKIDRGSWKVERVR